MCVCTALAYPWGEVEANCRKAEFASIIYCRANKALVTWPSASDYAENPLGDGFL